MTRAVTMVPVGLRAPNTVKQVSAKKLHLYIVFLDFRTSLKSARQTKDLLVEFYHLPFLTQGHFLTNV